MNPPTRHLVSDAADAPGAAGSVERLEDGGRQVIPLLEELVHREATQLRPGAGEAQLRQGELWVLHLQPRMGVRWARSGGGLGHLIAGLVGVCDAEEKDSINVDRNII